MKRILIGWNVAHGYESLLHMYEEPSFNPQNLRESMVWLQVSVTPAHEGGDGRVPGTNWPVSSAEMVHSRSSETSYLKGTK